MIVEELFADLAGCVSVDSYNTAWVALVPAEHDLTQPQWPEALAFLRATQLPDGGWGAPMTYHAHERTLCTLAAITALLCWRETAVSQQANDQQRIQHGLAALHKYALDLAHDPLELVGYELLLPRLVRLLEPYDLTLPTEYWYNILDVGQRKMFMIGNLEIEPSKPRTWWFSMEMLPEQRLAELDDTFLNHHGSIATSTAATAAFLRARRLHGKDSPRAAAFISRVLALGHGGASFSWPIEHYELLWILDQLKRVQFPASHPAVQKAVADLRRYWLLPPAGFAGSAAFAVADGDDTSVGYDVLCWGGTRPPIEPLLAFWNHTHFRTYLDELTASVTVNLHALSALQHDAAHQPAVQALGQATLEWLRPYLSNGNGFTDKWHFSPMYVAGHALETLLHWDKELAQKSLDFLLEQQRADGGWGCSARTTVEETGHALIGLTAAFRAGLLTDKRPLHHAAHFLHTHQDDPASERLWIGKTLFHSPKITAAIRFASHYALQQINIHPAK